MLDKQNVKEMLKRKRLPYQVELKKSPTSITDLEASLVDHTDIDNMDEDNKFICKACTEKEIKGMNRNVCSYIHKYFHANHVMATHI